MNKELLAVVLMCAEIRNVRKVRTSAGKVRKIGRWYYGDDETCTIYEGRSINGRPIVGEVKGKKVVLDSDTVKETFTEFEYVRRLQWLENQPERFVRQTERTDENGIGWGCFGEEPDESGYDLAEQTERSAID